MVVDSVGMKWIIKDPSGVTWVCKLDIKNCLIDMISLVKIDAMFLLEDLDIKKSECWNLLRCEHEQFYQVINESMEVTIVTEESKEVISLYQ